MLRELKDGILEEIYSIKKEITCSICLDVYTEPITLTSCQHTFCLECFKGLFSIKTSPKLIGCPICKKKTKRRSYYINEQFVKSIELINMYSNLLTLLEQKNENKKYDSSNMENFLNDCVKYQGVGEDFTISLSSDSDSELPQNMSETARKLNNLNESKSKVRVSKTPNKRVKPLKVVKRKGKTPKKSKQKSVENLNSEVINVDGFQSLDVDQLQENENKIVKLLEDDILRNFENEVKGLPKTDETDSSKKTTVSTGWSRMKTMKKQIKKKKYKQLNVSTEINKSKSKSPAEKHKTDDDILDEPIVVLHRIDPTINNNIVKNEDIEDMSHENKSHRPMDSLQIQEVDIFLISTQKLKSPPNSKEEIIEKNKDITNTQEFNTPSNTKENKPPVDTTPCSDIYEAAHFITDVQIHQCNTPIRVSPKLAKPKKPFKISKLNEENDDIISATERTPDSIKCVGVKTRRSLRSAVKKGSEVTAVVEKILTPKKRKLIENEVDSLVIEVNDSENYTTMIERQVSETHLSQKSTKHDGKTKVEEMRYITNGLELCTAKIPNAIAAVECGLNAADAILTECTNYINSPSLFSDSMNPENSKKSKTDFKTNEKLTVLSSFHSLPLQSNSRSSEEFRKTAIPCLRRIEEYYDQMISLSQKFSQETISFRNSLHSKECEKVLSFKSKPINTEAQTDDETCPKCSYVFKINDNIELAKESTSQDESKTSKKPGTANRTKKSYSEVFPHINEHIQLVCSDESNLKEPDVSKTKNKSQIRKKQNDSQLKYDFRNSFSSDSQILSSKQWVTHKKVNKQLSYSDESIIARRFKRIREPSSDSDSDSSKSKKSKVNYGELPYRDDIDIFFQSEPSQTNLNSSLRSQKNVEKSEKLSKSNEKISANTVQDKKENIPVNPEDNTLKYMSILEREYKDVHFSETDKHSVQNTILDKLLHSNLEKTESTSVAICSEDQRNVDNLLVDINFADFEHDSFDTRKQINIQDNTSRTPHEKTTLRTGSKFPQPHNDVNKNLDPNETVGIEKIQLEMITNELETENRKDEDLDKEVEIITSDTIVEDSVGSDKDLFEEDVVDSTPQKDMESKQVRNNLNLSKQLPELVFDIIKPPPTVTKELDWIDIVPPPPLYDDNEKVEEPKSNVPNMSSATPDIFAANNLDIAFFANSKLSGDTNTQTLNVQKESCNSDNVIASSVTEQNKVQNTSVRKGNRETAETNLDPLVVENTHTESINLQKESCNSDNVIASSVTEQSKVQNTSVRKTDRETTETNLNPIVVENTHTERINVQQESCNFDTVTASSVTSSVTEKNKLKNTSVREANMSLNTGTTETNLDPVVLGNINSKTINVQKESFNSNNVIANLVTVQNTSALKSNTSLYTTGRSLNPIVLAQKDKYSPLQIVVTSRTPKQIIPPAPKQQTSILSYMNTPQKENDANNLNRTQSRCGTPAHPAFITCSRLKRPDVTLVMSLTHKLGARFSRDFDKNVTHLIVSVDDGNRVENHTTKYLLAIVYRVWVVSIAWVRDSLQQNRLLPEEPYEVLDITGKPGPKISRLTGQSMPLLKNFVICCLGPLKSINLSDIQDIIAKLGGKTVVSLDDLLYEKDKHCLILVENQDLDDYQEWRETYNVLVVDMDWLFNVVGTYQIGSIRNYLLCQEEGINELGYPFALTAPASETPTQTTMSNTINY